MKPKAIQLLSKENSNPFTTKGKCLTPLIDEDLDFVIICRIDMHFSKVIATDNIRFDKFNFLFKEKGWWESHRFTCDNFYMFPYAMLNSVDKAISETFCYPRGWPLVDTHGLYDKLTQYVSPNDIHFISETHELSDINSYYTCCRTLLPIGEERMKYLHPSVKERYYNG
jgi:hypothetical protein